jgi:hypothetical protein
MEKAQAKAWLSQRDVAMPRERMPDVTEPVSVSRAPIAQVEMSTSSDQEKIRDETMATKAQPPASETPTNAARRLGDVVPALLPAGMPTHVFETPEVPDADRERQITQPWVEPRVRYQRRTLHLEQSGEGGFRLWIRDAAMDGQQAQQVASMVQTELKLHGKASELTALYLNGTQQSFDREE